MTAMIGLTTTLGIYNGSTYTNVIEVTAITPPQYSRDAVETTHLLSTNGYRTFIGGLKDGGSVSFDINWDPSNSDVVIAALEAATNGQFKITFPDATTCVFGGVVTGYQLGQVTPDGKLTASATIKTSGQPTWA